MNKILFIAGALLIFCVSCSVEDRLFSNDTEIIQLPDDDEPYVDRDIIVFSAQSEPFMIFDTINFVGNYEYSVYSNGTIADSGAESIEYSITPRTNDTVVVCPDKQKTFTVDMVEFSLKKGGREFSRQMAFQTRPEGIFLLFYITETGKIVSVPENYQQFYPEPMVTGFITDDDGTVGQDRSNSWNTVPFQPYLKDYAHRIDNSKTILEGFFASDLLGHPHYCIQGKYYFDGIDMKTYHQFHHEENRNGQTVRTTGHIQETNYLFKFEGISKIRVEGNILEQHGYDKNIRRLFSYTLERLP
ncbi:MAG: hypothetical protein ACQEQ4_04545 [Fibrobacterota bacterium]